MVQSKIERSSGLVCVYGEREKNIVHWHFYIREWERELKIMYIPPDVPSYLHSFLRPQHYLSLPFFLLLALLSLHKYTQNIFLLLCFNRVDFWVLNLFALIQFLCFPLSGWIKKFFTDTQFFYAKFPPLRPRTSIVSLIRS